MSFFDKMDDVLIVVTFKQISHRRDIDIKVFTLDALQIGTFYGICIMIRGIQTKTAKFQTEHQRHLC